MIDVAEEVIENVSQTSEDLVESLGEFDPEFMADKILAFCEFVADLPLYDYQKEFGWRMIYSLLVNDGEEITALFSRQSGKTETIAVILVGCLVIFPVLAKVFKELEQYTNGLWVGLFAPVYEQAATTHDRALLRIHTETIQEVLNDPDIQTKLIGRGINLDNGSYVRMMSASKQTNIESKTYHMVILEECVAGDTLVDIRDKGLTPITEVKVGDFVKTLDRNKNRVWDKVLNHWDKGIRDSFRVILSDGSYIDATDNHRIFTDQGWLTVKEIQERLLKHSIVCYTIPIQEVECETVNIRNTSWRWKYKLWRQKVLQVSQVQGKSFFQTKRIRRSQVRDFKRVCFNSTKENSQWWKGRLAVQISDKIFISVQRVLRSLLSTWEEVSNRGMGKPAYCGGSGLLVHGRWGIVWNRKNTPFCNTRIFNRGTENTQKEVTGFWNRFFITGRQANREMVYSSISQKQKSVLQIGGAFHNKEHEIQASRLRENSSLCDMREEVSDCKQNKEYLLRILQKGIKKALRSFFRYAGIQKRKNFRMEERSREQKEGYRKLQVVSVEEKTRERVYDIETEITHSFLANGILVHNCQDIDQMKILKSIHPMLASTNGTAVKVGTPNGKKCEFLDAIKRNRRNDINVRDKRKRNHYQYDYKTCEKYNLRYKKYVDKERARFGEEGDFFRMAYRLHWMIEIGVFISEEMFDACLVKSLKTVDSNITGIHVFGLDIGKAVDSTVVTVLELDVEDIDEYGFYKKRIVSWLEIRGEDYESQFWQIKDYLSNFRILRGCVDKTAVGDPIADRLYALYEDEDIEIDPITFSTQSKSQMYKYLLQEFNALRLIIPGHPSVTKTRIFNGFRGQLLDLEKNWRGQYMVVQHPAERGAHDDYPDSLALACWAGSEIFLREIEPMKINPFQRGPVNPLFSRKADRTIFRRRL